MGPALLPTPLLPARGRFGFADWPHEASCLLHLKRAWRPASVPRPVVLFVGSLAVPFVLHRLASRYVTGARAGIRPCFLAASLWLAEAFLSADMPLGMAEVALPWWLAGQALFIRTRKRFPTAIAIRYRDLHDDFASHSPQSSRLASGRNLLHCVSQTARGQSPPYLWFVKNSVNQGLAAFFSEPPFPEDKLRLRSNRRFGKVC